MIIHRFGMAFDIGDAKNTPNDYEYLRILNAKVKILVYDSPPTAACPVTCLCDRQRTCHVSFERRDTLVPCTLVGQRHATVACSSYSIDEEYEVVTSQVDEMTSEISYKNRMCLLPTQSSATYLTSDHQLTLARYSSSGRRCTVAVSYTHLTLPTKRIV